MIAMKHVRAATSALSSTLRKLGRLPCRPSVLSLVCVGYCFEFLPVYAQHAPQRLTVADWAGALGVSAFSTGKRLLRIAYATTLWGVALPLLTVVAEACVPPAGTSRQWLQRC